MSRTIVEYDETAKQFLLFCEDCHNLLHQFALDLNRINLYRLIQESRHDCIALIDDNTQRKLGAFKIVENARIPLDTAVFVDDEEVVVGVITGITEHEFLINRCVDNHIVHDAHQWTMNDITYWCKGIK